MKFLAMPGLGTQALPERARPSHVSI